jgi:glyoxylase-like metal-dependent hydrolase (beta-lactamase superfamily II)
MSEEQGTGFYRFKIGDFKVATISDGFTVFDNPKALFGGDADDTEYESLLESKFLSPQTLYTHIDALFVDTGKNKVLIDNGTGPYFGPTAGHLAGSLRNLGISPEDIDTVFLSHGHLDHLGGCVGPDGALLFPQARYFMGEKEWAFWTQPDVPIGQPYPDAIKQMVVKVAKEQLEGIKEQVEFVKSGQELVTGITAVEAFGHSAGMLAANIASGSESLFYAADALIHSAISVEYPDWLVGLDNDRAEAAATRRRIVDRVTAEKSLVFAPHFPFPGIGHIAKFGLSQRWEPSIWTW